MSEAVEQVHKSTGAGGDLIEEYRAVREEGGGLIDLSARGRIEIGGTEAVLFLNGLITNDVKALSEDSWMEAVFPNAQGRTLAHARVLRSGDTFLFDTESSTREQIVKTLSRFTLAGDFRVADVTDDTSLLSLQGKRSAEIVGRVLGEEAAQTARGRIFNASWNDESLRVIRATHTSEDGFDLFMKADLAPSLRDALLEAGARPFGFDALEVLRIEAGLPRYGLDFDETKVVLETGLDNAVSFTKGCYIGQEIVARIHFRGHVAKRLAGVALEEGEALRDDKLRTVEGKEVGWITSPAYSPRLNQAIALGYVKYDYLQPGTELRVTRDGAEHRARVVELPFVRGSWYATEEQGGMMKDER
jgi:folate-binding protein YgfZ